MNTYLLASDATTLEILQKTVQSQSLTVQGAVVRSEGKPCHPISKT